MIVRVCLTGTSTFHTLKHMLIGHNQQYQTKRKTTVDSLYVHSRKTYNSLYRLCT